MKPETPNSPNKLNTIISALAFRHAKSRLPDLPSSLRANPLRSGRKSSRLFASTV